MNLGNRTEVPYNRSHKCHISRQRTHHVAGMKLNHQGNAHECGSQSV